MGTLKALGWGLKGKKWSYLKRILNSAMWEQKNLGYYCTKLTPLIFDHSKIFKNLQNLT